jgi:hypothetical protein
MTTEPTSHREWFTPVWVVVPVLLILLVAAYGLSRGPTVFP